jgi:hypothetical protein
VLEPSGVHQPRFNGFAARILVASRASLSESPTAELAPRPATSAGSRAAATRAIHAKSRHLCIVFENTSHLFSDNDSCSRRSIDRRYRCTIFGGHSRCKIEIRTRIRCIFSLLIAFRNFVWTSAGNIHRAERKSRWYASSERAYRACRAECGYIYY